MQKPITQIVIVGGGTAGWITAGLLAAEHNVDKGILAHSPKLNITLIESPDVATIGVGEGTWPSMRSTLRLHQDYNKDLIVCMCFSKLL